MSRHWSMRRSRWSVGNMASMARWIAPPRPPRQAGPIIATLLSAGVKRRSNPACPAFFNRPDRLREMRLRSRKGSRAAQSAPMADCEHVTSGLDGSVAHYFRCKSTVSGDDRTVQNVHPIRETDSCSATDSGSNQDRSTRTSEPDPLCEAAQ
ncbi:hypothetical protein SPHINGO391_520026 [Sphingomonas aurantiaca]|uniref:Uncharacterized protein n=1 Tax=Sphingomonas aurantiaca TaxID=185949 RepID=A0A5E8AGP4_9SPHN|nr:hypothetical protein SPHINGO391_520026 [Sphingomonas aurantiaca]